MSHHMNRLIEAVHLMGHSICFYAVTADSFLIIIEYSVMSAAQLIFRIFSISPSSLTIVVKTTGVFS